MVIPGHHAAGSLQALPLSRLPHQAPPTTSKNNRAEPSTNMACLPSRFQTVSDYRCLVQSGTQNPLCRHVRCLPEPELPDAELIETELIRLERAIDALLSHHRAVQGGNANI